MIVNIRLITVKSTNWTAPCFTIKYGKYQKSFFVNYLVPVYCCVKGRGHGISDWSRRSLHLVLSWFNDGVAYDTTIYIKTKFTLLRVDKSSSVILSLLRKAQLGSYFLWALNVKKIPAYYIYCILGCNFTGAKKYSKKYERFMTRTLLNSTTHCFTYI